MARTAMVLFNLGGPDGPRAVRPFLFNLFNDPAIIGAPTPIRWMLAKFIAARRAPIAREIYGRLGGGSPLLPNTEAQSEALREALADLGEVRTFIAMRHWHPLTEEAAADVAAFDPDRIARDDGALPPRHSDLFDEQVGRLERQRALEHHRALQIVKAPLLPEPDRTLAHRRHDGHQLLGSPGGGRPGSRDVLGRGEP